MAALIGQGTLTLDQAAEPLEFEADSELAVSLRG